MGKKKGTKQFQRLPPFKGQYCICYKSKLFLGYSIFKLVYFFQTRSICLNLGQFVSTKISLGQVKKTGHRPKSNRPKDSFNECLGYFPYWQAMTCDLWLVTCVFHRPQTDLGLNTLT